MIPQSPQRSDDLPDQVRHLVIIMGGAAGGAVLWALTFISAFAYEFFFAAVTTGSSNTGYPYTVVIPGLFAAFILLVPVGVVVGAAPAALAGHLISRIIRRKSYVSWTATLASGAVSVTGCILLLFVLANSRGGLSTQLPQMFGFSVFGAILGLGSAMLTGHLINWRLGRKVIGGKPPVASPKTGPGDR
jgi:hypothetical protein